MKRLILQTYYRHDKNLEDPKTGCYIPVDDLATWSQRNALGSMQILLGQTIA